MYPLSSKALRLFMASLFFLVVISGCASKRDSAPSESTVDTSKLEKSGTLTFKGRAYNLIIGGTWGEGVLNYNGQAYRFKAKSVGAGYAIGVKETQMKGTVYNLNKVDDFSGTYWGVKAGATVALGAGAANVENKNGVVLGLKGTSKGVAIDVSAFVSRIVVELIE